MLNAATWPSIASRGTLTYILAALLLPAVALAEAHEIHGINHRKYESMFFEPQFLRMEPGDSIEFVVTAFDHQPQSVLVPAGADHWKAEKGKSIEVTLTQEGVYIYDCAYHNVMGMAGVLVVGRPLNAEEARLFFEQYRKETFAMNKDRLNEVWDSIVPVPGVQQQGRAKQ